MSLTIGTKLNITSVVSYWKQRVQRKSKVYLLINVSTNINEEVTGVN